MEEARLASGSAYSEWLILDALSGAVEIVATHSMYQDALRTRKNTETRRAC